MFALRVDEAGEVVSLLRPREEERRRGRLPFDLGNLRLGESQKALLAIQTIALASALCADTMSQLREAALVPLSCFHPCVIEGRTSWAYLSSCSS
jgi:hypothetical protein